MKSLPQNFDMSTMKASNYVEHVATLVEHANKRFPWINKHTPMEVTTGILTFSPDGLPFCGQLPDYKGLFYATGFSGHGIAQSPAIGLIMSELILDGKSPYCIASIDADRYWDMPGFQDRKEIQQRCYEMQGSYYGRLEGKSATSQKSK